jgi:SAM-dependent methyltransferase
MSTWRIDGLMSVPSLPAPTVPAVAPSHALLVLPSANRVYTQSAPARLAAELAALDALALGGRLGAIEVEVLGGVPYVTFGGGPDAGGLDGEALAVVSNLSSVYALDDDLVTIPRYSGKTNEQLTRLLLNLTLAAAGGAAPFAGQRLRVLDPLCGRGTTMNVAVQCGFDAAGVDVDRKDVDAYLQFFTTWLKDKRAKHSSRRNGTRTTITFAADKEAQRAGAGQEVVVAVDDTANVVAHLGKSSVDVVVTDLPYGVQHGSHTGDGLRRSPRALLHAALPAWRSALRPGGAVGLSWNTKVLPRTDVAAALEEAGFSVVTGEPFERFGHRVDQSIERDLVVARRSS